MTGRRLPVAIASSGWVVIAMALVGVGLGAAFGWTELIVIGLVALVVVLISAGFLIGRSSGRIEIDVLDARVVAGEPATVAVRVTNDAPRRQRPHQAEFVVGDRVEIIRLPGLAAGESQQVLVLVPTVRRGVITLGPVTIVRRDPLGLARRESVRSETAELYVHPAIVSLPVSTTGLLRDLEGIATSDLTDSDMSFHALRPYVAGDDRRHIHWKSTAKSGSFLVRQFEQTRRSHLIVLQSLCAADYSSEEEFELAVSVVASIGVRAISDGATVSVFAGAGTRRRAHGGGRLRVRTPRELLDDLSAVEESSAPRAARVAAVARSVGESAPDASVVFLACGSTVTARQLRAAASHFATGVEVVAVVAEPEAEATLVRIDSLRITRIGYLDDLVRTLARAVGV